MNGGKHEPLQGQRGAGCEQRRQRAGGHFAQEIAARAREVDAAELQDVVASGVVQLARAKRVVLLVAMFWRGFEGFLERVRSAGIGIGDDESGFIEAGFLTHAEHSAVTRHDAARQLQMRKTLAGVRMRRRKNVHKGLADHADD